MRKITLNLDKAECVDTNRKFLDIEASKPDFATFFSHLSFNRNETQNMLIEKLEKFGSHTEKVFLYNQFNVKIDSSFDKVMESMKNLRELYLEQCELNIISSTIWNFNQLTSLTLMNVDIQVI